MGHTATPEESYASLYLPVANFSGSRVRYLDSKFSGASNLANLTLRLAMEHEPSLSVQIWQMARRGRLHLATRFVAPDIGNLLVEVHVGDHGNSAGLSTVQKTSTEPHEAWEAVWTRTKDEYGIVEAAHRTLRGAESYSYVDNIPEIDADPTPLELATLGNLGLRAAQRFEEYNWGLIAAGEALVVRSVQLQASRTAVIAAD